MSPGFSGSKMILELIKIQWKETSRSSFWKKDLLSNIFIFILYLIIALNFLAFGLAIKLILDQVAPGENHILLFNSYIIVYFASELLVRFFIQKVHSFKIIPFLYLPVRSSLIKNYLLIKPFWSPFNFTPFLVALPFAIIILPGKYNSAEILFWLINMFFFIQLINYLNLFMNRLAMIKPYFSVMYVGVLLLLTSSGILDFLSVREFAGGFFLSPLENPLMIMFPFVGALMFYLFNYILVNERFYLEDLETKPKSSLSRFSNINLAAKFGEVGAYISLELKLLLRNKRPSSSIIFAFPVLLFGFIAYGNEAYKDSYFFSVYFGVFLVSLFMIFYGQFLFGWESSYFDAILGKNINLRKYLQAKYYLLVGMCTISFFLTLPYSLYGIKILFANFNIYLFSIGVSSYFMILLGTYSRKRIDIQVGLMSMQGKGATQFIVVLPILLVPILISIPIEIFYDDYYAYSFLGFLGVLGMVFNKSIMNFLYRQFLSQKYKLAEAFREAE